MAAAVTVSPDMLVGFVQLVKKFSNDPCFQKVKDLMDEQSTLRADLEKLQTAFEVNLKYLEAQRQKVTELQNQLTDERATIQSLTVSKEEVETEVAEFRRDLEESTAKLQEQQKALENHKEENGILKKQRDSQKKDLDAERSSKEFAERKLRSVEQDLSDAKDSLAASNKEVGRHKNLAPPLKELSKEDVISALQMIFQSVEHLVKSHFWVDIDEKNLKKFLTHEAMKGVHDIPLPLSNSSAAKNMRVAVAMKVLGSAMVDRIFTPVHLGDKSNEFDSFLLDSVFHDPERAATLRSVVLKISDNNPDHAHEERAESVATGAMDCLRLLLPPDKVNTVNMALETICSKAIERWARLQWNTNVILPLTAASSTPSQQHYWLPLRLLETGEAAQAVTPQCKPSATSGKTRQVSNGSVGGSQPRTTQVNGSSTNNKTSTGKAANHKPDDSKTAGTAVAARPSIAVANVASVIWPAFYSIKDQRMIQIQPGFVLTTAQVAAAQQESSDQRQSGHHRDIRQGSRRRSLAATSQKNGSAGPTDFFLSEDGNEQETG